MATVTRWLASTALAAGLGLVTLAAPATAQAQSGDDLVRVIVDVADVIYRAGDPYYRYGDERLILDRDRYGRPIYYRNVSRSGPPYGKAHGYWKKHGRTSRVSCDRYGRCVTRYYDPRYDRRYDYSYGRDHYDRYDRYDRYGRDGRDRYDRYRRYERDGRYWDGYRWRDGD